MKKFVHSLTAACVILSLAACSSPSSNSGSSDAATQTDGAATADVSEDATEEVPEEIVEDSNYAVGDTATLGDWEITVSSFSVNDNVRATYGSFTPDDGNKYVVVDLTVKNIGTSSNTFTGYSLNSASTKIVYKDTYEYSSSRLIGHDQDVHDQSVNPLASYTGILAYQIVEEAANSDELAFTVKLNGKDITFDLK